MDIGRQGTEIEWFLSTGTSAFWRSTFGPTLDRQHSAYYDSEGQRIPTARETWDRAIDARQRPIAYMLDAALGPHTAAEAEEMLPPHPWHTTQPLSEEHGAVDRYEVDDATLVRFARVSRRMRIIETQAPTLHATLVAYHGNTGSRWALEAPPSGRLVAVYPLTTTGAKWVEALIAREQSDRTEHDAAMGKWRAARAAGRNAPMPASPPPMLDLRPDERLANEAALQRTRATDIRRARLVRVEREATELVGRAHALYAQIDGAMWDATRQARARRIMAARAGA